MYIHIYICITVITVWYLYTVIMVKEDTQTRSPVLYFFVFGGFSCLHMLCDLGMILTKSWHHYLRRIGKYWQEPKDKVYSFLSCGLFLSRVKWWMNLSPKIKYIHIYVYIYVISPIIMEVEHVCIWMTTTFLLPWSWEADVLFVGTQDGRSKIME